VERGLIDGRLDSQVGGRVEDFVASVADHRQPRQAPGTIVHAARDDGLGRYSDL